MSDQSITGRTVVNLAGRVTARGAARLATGSNVVTLAGGVITARGTARLDTGHDALFLAGIVTAKGTTSLAVALVPPHPLSLAGNIVAAGGVRGSIRPWVLSGTIHAQGTIRGTTPPYLSGRIVTQAKVRGSLPPILRGIIHAQGQIHGSTPPYLSGRINAQGTAQTQQAVFTHPIVYGRITATSRVHLNSSLFSTRLSGTITSASNSSLAGRLLPLAGNVTASSRAQLLQTRLSLSLSGRIAGISNAQFGHGPYYTTNLLGRISSAAYVQGLARPRQPLIGGNIHSASSLSLLIAEVAEPLPPYPPPFLTHVTSDYLNYITSEHNQKPKYMASVGFSIDPGVEDQQLVAGIAGLFDLDYCVGEQEDFTGEWIGKSRWIELPNVFFTWDSDGQGWNQANWKGPGDAEDTLQSLDDYHYRLLLYATVIANHWNGSIPAAYEAWDTLFRYAGLKVIIQDYGNMTMLYGILSTGTLDLVLMSLFLGGQMDLRPEGVQLIAYALQAEPGAPFFAWDSHSDAVQGWDSGSWGVMVPPGQAFPPLLP